MIIRKNQDEAKVKEIREKLKANDGYCPCAIRKTEDTKCICKEFLNKQTPGYCHCQLYYKEEV